MTFQQELWLDMRDHAKRVSFFITALVPACFILLIRYALSADAALLVFLLLALPVAVIPAVVILYLRRTASASGGFVNINVKKKFDITRDTALYTLTCIPVVLIEDFVPEHLIIFLSVLAIIYVMYTKFNLFHINPIISIFYRTYRVVDDHGNTVMVFAKLNVRAGSDLSCLEISENLYVAATGDR